MNTRYNLNSKVVAEIDLFFEKMNIIFEKLYTEYTKLNESNNIEDANLLLEGFWGKVGNVLGGAAAGIRNAAVGATDYVRGLGQDALAGLKGAGKYMMELGQKLGQQAVSAINSFITTVGSWMNQAADFLMSAPGKFMDFVNGTIEKIQEGWADIQAKYAEIKEKAGEAWNGLVAAVTEKIVKPIQAKYDAICQSIVKNWERFKWEVNSKKIDVQVWYENSVNSGQEELAKLGTKFKEILNKSVIVAGEAGIFVLGMIVLPFAITIKGGQMMANGILKAIQVTKEYIPKAWNELKTGAVDTYQQKTSEFDQRRQQFENITIKKFADYISEKKKEKKDDDDKCDCGKPKGKCVCEKDGDEKKKLSKAENKARFLEMVAKKNKGKEKENK